MQAQRSHEKMVVDDADSMMAHFDLNSTSFSHPIAQKFISTSTPYGAEHAAPESRSASCVDSGYSEGYSSGTSISKQSDLFDGFNHDQKLWQQPNFDEFENETDDCLKIFASKRLSLDASLLPSNSVHKFIMRRRSHGVGQSSSSIRLKRHSLDLSAKPYSADLTDVRRRLSSFSASSLLHDPLSPVKLIQMAKCHTSPTSSQKSSSNIGSHEIHNISPEPPWVSELTCTVPPSSEISQKTNVLSHQRRFQAILDKFAPKDHDRLIGRKMGLETVDIIGEIYSRSMTGVLGKILSYVPDSDLCSIAHVGSEWKKALKAEPIARERRKRYLSCQKQIIAETPKENRNLPKKKASRELTSAALPMTIVQVTGDDKGPPNTSDGPPLTLPMTIVQVTGDDKGPTGMSDGPPLTLHQQFLQVASTLRPEESLRKCPKCQRPAKMDSVQERAICTSPSCAFDCCIKCKSWFHGSEPCQSSPKKAPRVTVGSRQSKKNLRRL